MSTTTPDRVGATARMRLTSLLRPLAALGLLLATACAAHAQTINVFAYTGSTQTYQVPAGVTRLQVVATGASGGAGDAGRPPARGAQVTATLAVTPLEVLTVVVGGRGGRGGPNTGGYNGGGNGGGLTSGGAGGGATDLRRAPATALTTDYLPARNALVVAGGGGGGGYDGVGGSGGTPTGGNGTGNDLGQGATQNSAGAGGYSAGSANQGGSGGGAITDGGGGGGGGYYGGGSGGGGGSSWVTAGAMGVSYALAPAAGDGALTITPIIPLPISSLAPVPNAVAVSASSNVQVSFGQTLTASSAAALQVFSAQRGGRRTAAVPATVSGNQLTFSPSAYAFRRGEVVSATVTTAAQGSGGERLVVPYVFQFTTATGGTGRGTFGGGLDPSVGSSPQSVATGDVDGDGDLDLLTADQGSNSVSVRLNQGNGTFGPGSTVGVGRNPSGVALGDVDGDGDLDLLAANINDNTVSVRLNQGNGTFAGTQAVNVGGSPFNVTLGDVDGDGDLDLLAANFSNNTVSVRLNQGVGTFGPGSEVNVGTNPYGLALGDADGDGDLDLLTANLGDNTVSVRLNQGGGTFGPGSDVSVGTTPSSVTLGDVDKDGDLDLLAANNGSNTVSVRLNQGSGTFGPGSDVSVGTNPINVALGDVDSDGDLDLLAASNGSVSVRFNQGNGTFTGTQAVSVGSGPSSVALGDVDGDGDLDLLAANANDNTVSVRLNQPPAPTITSLSPGSGPVGTQVTLMGSNLDGATAVTFAGTSNNTVTMGLTVSGTGSSQTLTVAVPTGATTGNVTVTTPGGTSNGLAFTVTPPVAAPTVTTTTPTSVTSASATLGGTVSSNGNSPVTGRGVVYSTTNQSPTVGGAGVAQAPNGSGTGSFSATIAGLSASTRYYVAAYATNSVGTSYGATLTFLTAANAPTVTTTTPSSITSSSAVLGGNVTADGGAPVTTRGIVYSLTSTNATPTIGGPGTVIDSNNTGTGSFSTTVSGFPPGTSYSVQAYAINSQGTSYGGVQTFTTAPIAPTVTTAAASNVTPTSATLGGNLLATGGSPVTERGVVYVVGTGTPTTADTKALVSTSGNSPGSFSGTVTGLSATTQYSVRAYATNSQGTSYGSLTTFTTAALPTTTAPVLTNPAANSTTNGQPTYAGTAPAGSTVTIYLAMCSGAAQAIGTTTATGGSFSLTPATALPDGTYAVYATAQSSGANVSASSNVNTFTVDATPPTVTLATSASNPTTNPFIPFSATFSEPVTGFSASGITVTNGTIVGVGNVGNTYNFTVQATATGPVTVSIAAGAAQDAAGNGNVAAGPLSVTYALPMSVAPVLLSPTNGSTTGSPVIIGGTAPTGSFVSITVTNLGNGVSSSRSTSATNNNFSSQFSLPSGTYRAVATAQQSGSQPASSAPITFTVDATPPTATISSAAGGSTSTAPIPFTVSFSEPIQSFSASSVQVSNGTITSAITTTGNDYNFSVTPTAGGLVTVTLPAGAVRDRFGNANTSASSLGVTYAAPITATTWTGAVSTNWFDATNWTQGVPTATVDATINAVSSGRYPLLTAGSATAAARNLTIGASASLAMSGGTLDVRAGLDNNGTFAATGGTVVLGTSTTSTLRGSNTTSFWNLQVDASGASLATMAGAAVQQVLTLNGNFSTNSNTFTLRSTAASTALVVNSGGVVLGTATVQRAIDPSLNPGLGYRHYAAPVSSSTVGDLATSGFTPVVNPAYNTSPLPASVTPYPTVFGYDDSRLVTTASNNLGSFDKGYFSPAALSDPLTPGRGYTVNIAASEVVDFQGTLINGDLPLTLTSTRPTYPDGGWQFLGNPYPAPLDYRLVAPADRQGLESAIYVYSSTSQYAGRYRSYVNGIGNSVLPLGQGFFARVASGVSAATMTFRNSQRLTAPNNTAFQRPAADPRPLVQLLLQGPGAGPPLADEATVYFEPGATLAFEPAFDAVKLPNPTGLNLSTSLPNGQQLSIDGQPELGTAQRVVPLAVGVPAAGSYTFTASLLLNLSAVPVYLRDRQLNTLTDLRLTPSYSFTVSSATAMITSRFELIFSPQQPLATVPAALAQQVALYPNPARTQVVIDLPASLSRQPVTATLLDALGRVVRQQVLPAKVSAHTLPLTDMASGVYSLRLTTEAGTVVKKLLVE